MNEKQEMQVVIGYYKSLSSEAVAASLSLDVTEVNSKFAELEAKDKKASARAKPRPWTVQEDEFLRTTPLNNIEAGAAIGRTQYSVARRRSVLNLVSKRNKPYSEQDKADLRKLYADYMPVEDIADQLGRSWGSVRQQIFFMKLKRSNRLFNLVQHYGREVLNLGNSPDEIMQAIASEHAMQLYDMQQARLAANKATLEAGCTAWQTGQITRAEAFRRARREHITLQAIGDRYGLTRERVRQILENDK